MADFFHWSFIQSGEEEQTPEERRTRLKKADSIRRMLADGSTVPVVTSKILLFMISFIYMVEITFFLLTTLCGKFEKYIQRNETAQPRSQFPQSCICERFIYSHDRPTDFAAANRLNDHGNI